MEFARVSSTQWCELGKTSAKLGGFMILGRRNRV